MDREIVIFFNNLAWIKTVNFDSTVLQPGEIHLIRFAACLFDLNDTP